MRIHMMNMLSPKLILLLTILLMCFGAAAAQDNPQQNRPQQHFDNPQPNRMDMLRALGLTQEQFQQIRRINQARKPEMDRAALRLRLANRALDEAIYADTVDEALFQARLKEFQLAQAEVTRLRFIGEFNVRKILTAEQLNRFREMQRRFVPPPTDLRRGAVDRNPDRFLRRGQ